MKKSLLLLVLITLGITSQSLLACGTNPPPSVPDAASTAALLSVAFGGLVCLRNRFRR